METQCSCVKTFPYKRRDSVAQKTVTATLATSCPQARALPCSFRLHLPVTQMERLGQVLEENPTRGTSHVDDGESSPVDLLTRGRLYFFTFPPSFFQTVKLLQCYTHRLFSLRKLSKFLPFLHLPFLLLLLLF